MQLLLDKFIYDLQAFDKPKAKEIEMLKACDIFPFFGLFPLSPPFLSPPPLFYPLPSIPRHQHTGFIITNIVVQITKQKEQALLLEDVMDTAHMKIPLPILSNCTNPTFLDVHPLELARQLTITDFELFQEAVELIGCPWTKKGAELNAPHVMEMIKRFNNISFWVATEIVATPNKKQRLAVLKQFLHLLGYLKGMHNYHATMAVYCGLMMFEIQRLTLTWKGLGSKENKYLDEVTKFLSSNGNWSILRTTIIDLYTKNKHLPIEKQIAIVPFHGTYLKAFVGIDENPTYDPKNNLVNVYKMELISTQIEEIRKLQRNTIKFYEVEVMQKCIARWISSNVDEETLLRLSKCCESSSEFHDTSTTKKNKLKMKPTTSFRLKRSGKT
eukprot:TRINITY_DN5854_c0_g2_i4.p1 TRINITY_DN5854_c0_g2~~TRINITY_DN5854_c0_g2_i4.p1  ORF type:complete len:385 (+),score=95.20 TRINITY_DN5854_c0_g2_i4:219-1373(+)